MILLFKSIFVILSLWGVRASFSSAAEEVLDFQNSRPMLVPTDNYVARQNQILQDLGFLQGSLTDFHIYRCSFPEKEKKPLLFLGTFHSLPHRIFPENIWTMLLDQEELYVEQKNGPVLRFDESSKDYIHALTDQQKDMGKDFLSFLGYAPHTFAHVSLESLVQIFYRFHHLFGMDMQILMDYTHMKKSVFQLDEEKLSYTSLDEWIQDAKEVLKTALCHDNFRPEYAAYIRTQLETIDKNPFPIFLEHYIQNVGTAEYMKNLAEYLDHQYIRIDLQSGDNAEQRSFAMMHERNQRWINLIHASMEQKPTTSKLFAFGIDHMYDILDDLHKKGGTFERLQVDGSFLPYSWTHASDHDA